MAIATNAAILLSGDTGSGKSSLIATAAEYLYQTTGKAMRLYTCDGGGYPEAVEVAIHRGMIEPWRLRTRVGSGGEGLIEETCARASQGWWPKEFIDPLQGTVPEGVELQPWTTTTFVLVCPNGHEV
jgi:energy-coupling factor transporter ATP-binding protein EcfA2